MEIESIVACGRTARPTVLDKRFLCVPSKTSASTAGKALSANDTSNKSPTLRRRRDGLLREELFQFLRQEMDIDRLGEKIIAAGFEAFFLVALHGVGG